MCKWCSENNTRRDLARIDRFQAQACASSGTYFPTRATYRLLHFERGTASVVGSPMHHWNAGDCCELLSAW